MTKAPKVSVSPGKKKKPPTGLPTPLQKLKTTTTEFLKLRLDELLGAIDERVIIDRNLQEITDTPDGPVPFPVQTPMTCQAGDEVWLPYDNDTKDETVCYRARCMYANGNFRGFQFYKTPNRPAEDVDYFDTYTDNDKGNCYLIKRQPVENDKTTQKQMIQTMQTDQKRYLTELKTEVTKLVTAMEKQPKQDEKAGEQMLQTLQTIQKQTKPTTPPQQSRGAWGNPLNTQINNQGYHTEQSWIIPNQQTRQMQYPTTVDLNTQAIIRGVPYSNTEDVPKVVRAIIERKNLHHYITGMINPHAINPEDYTCKRALSNGVEPDATKPPPIIIVTFKTRDQKMTFIKTKIDGADMTAESLFPDSVNDDNRADQIYISENLSVEQRQLFFLARNFKKDKNYQYAWTKHGTVYVRKDTDTRAQRIDSEQDLTNLAFDT
jgi:hypothetical protein